MTRRKPPGLSWESWIDRQIREGQERGEFDNLAGTGEPLADLDRPHDEMWWVRKKLRAEDAGFLPPTLALRKEKEEVMAGLEVETSEVRVRHSIERLNERIRDVNRRAAAGPPSTLMVLDVEAVVSAWRRRRPPSVLEKGLGPDLPAPPD